jgi:tetratricopeptide (TPR) repeat protein
MSLLNTDWYIDQMVRAAYDAQPVPFTLKRDEYRQGTRDVVYYVDRGVSEQRWMAKDFVNWIKRTDPKATVESNGKKFNYYPTKKIRVPVNREKVLANGTVSEADTADLLPYIDWNLPGNNLLKRDLMIVDLIANNNWERPIYFAITVGNRPSSFLNLTDYFRLEGMAFRLVPLKRGGAGNGQLGFVDADIMYQNMMNEFNWGNMNDSTVYLDETNRRMMMNFRNNFSRLAEALIQKGDVERAKMVLDKSLEIMPNHIVLYDFFNLSIAEGYYTIGDVESARSILGVLGKNMMQEIQYYEQFTGAQKKLVSTELQRATQLYQFILQTATASGDGEWFRTASVSWE